MYQEIYIDKEREKNFYNLLAEMFAYTKFREEFPLASEQDIIDIAYWIVDHQKGLSFSMMRKAFLEVRASDPRYVETCRRKK